MSELRSLDQALQTRWSAMTLEDYANLCRQDMINSMIVPKKLLEGTAVFRGGVEQKEQKNGFRR